MFEYNNLIDTYRYCVNLIQSLKSKSKKFYIGATHNPNERLEEHIKEKNMKTMILLCKCLSKNQTIKLEQKLIKRYGKNVHIVNDIKYDEDEDDNIIQGGGGEGIIHDKNYIYLLLV